MNCNQSNKNTAICKLFDILFDYYGPQHWWPCQSGVRWEIISGAILTQNTAWTNVEKAIGNLLGSDVMSPETVLATPDDKVQKLIRPAGFFTQKSAYLKAMAAFMLEHEDEFEQSADVWALRKQLLSVKGVGRETADSILLYAFDKPIFVIDAYTRRIAQRHLYLDNSVHYDILQKIFMDALPADVTIYNEYHALIVALCKDSCHKAGCGERCKSLRNSKKCNIRASLIAFFKMRFLHWMFFDWKNPPPFFCLFSKGKKITKPHLSRRSP